MNTKPEPKSIAIAIGIITARADIKEYNAFLRLFSESGIDDGAYFPSQDIQIYGDDNIKSLRDFCNTILEERKKLFGTNET